MTTTSVHDYCLPRSFLKKENLRLIFGIKGEATPLSAVEAEAVGFGYLVPIAQNFPPRGEDWYDRFTVYARVGALVLRTVLVAKDDYLAQLESARDWEGAAIEAERLAAFRNRLPDRFWLVEASAPELFASSRRKFGEVLLAANQPLPKPLNISLLIAVRLPGITILPNPRSLDVRPTVLKGHTPLFTLPPRTGVIAC